MKIPSSDERAICGLHAVEALASCRPHDIQRFFLRRELLPRFKSLCKILSAQRKPYNICEDEELARLAQTTHHQGVVAMAKTPPIQEFPQKDLRKICAAGEHIVLLEEVGNDHNVGAIARSAAFFGIKHLVLAHSGAFTRLSTTAYRIAEGGLEYLHISTLKDIVPFIKEARSYCLVVATSPRAEHPLSMLSRLRKGAGQTVLFLLGNEERGLSPELLEAAHYRLSIPGTGAVESLNVAQAANLCMYELHRGLEK